MQAINVIVHTLTMEISPIFHSRKEHFIKIYTLMIATYFSGTELSEQIVNAVTIDFS